MPDWWKYPDEHPDPPCEVCGEIGCDCPECPECGVAGDPACYLPGSHGLVRTQAQVASLRRAVEQADADRKAEAAFFATADVERAMGPATDEFRDRAKWAIRGYWRGAGLEWVKDTLESLFADLFPGQSIRIREHDVEPPPSAPDPPPPDADYMVFLPGRIEFRAHGSGQHDPVVATVTAEAFLRAMRAAGVVMESKEDDAS